MRDLAAVLLLDLTHSEAECVPRYHSGCHGCVILFNYFHYEHLPCPHVKNKSGYTGLSIHEGKVREDTYLCELLEF